MQTSPLRTLSASVLLVSLLVSAADPAHSEESPDDDTHLEQTRSAVWQSVDRLASRYREPWYEGAGDIAVGGVLLWAGTRRMLQHYRTGNPRAGSWNFPWFGLFFTLNGAQTVASGLHRMVTPNPAARHAARLVSADLPDRAGLLFLRHRAEQARRERVARGITRMASSAGAATYLLLLPTNSRKQRLENVVSASLSAVGGAVMGIYWLVSKSFEERLYRDVKSQTPSTEASGRWRLHPSVRLSVGSKSRASGTLGLHLRW